MTCEHRNDRGAHEPALTLSSFAIYETVVRNMSEAVYVRDLERGLVYINPAAERLTGWSLEEALKRPCYEVFGDEGTKCDSVCPVDRSIVEQRAIQHLEGQLVTRSGDVIDCGVSISPILEDDEIVGSVVVLEDRSVLREMERTNLKQLIALQKAEDSLTDALERFQSFAGISSDWFWETDAEFRIVSIFGREDVDLSQFVGRVVPQEVDGLNVAESQLEEYLSIAAERAPYRDIRISLRQPDGTVIWANASGKPLFAADGTFRGYLGVARDISEQVRLEEEIQRQANHDGLTGLPNRRWFGEILTTQLALAVRHGEVCALLYVDLDGFKSVNDRLGHRAGDALLETVAERLNGCVRAGDTVARLGGDEFAVLLPHLRDRESAGNVGEKVLCALSEPIPLSEGEARIGASIGIALHPDHAADAETLLAAADAAMYESKRAGKNRLTVAEGSRLT